MKGRYIVIGNKYFLGICQGEDDASTHRRKEV
jgi:hypothetical protein